MAVILEENPDVFFLPESCDIYLSRKAAIEVCEQAYSRGIVILDIEPFIHTGMIQPVLDFAFSQKDIGWPMQEDIEEHNNWLAKYIGKFPVEINACVLIGWPINSKRNPFRFVYK